MFRVCLVALHISDSLYSFFTNCCASYPAGLCSQRVVATVADINKSSEHHLGAQACYTDMEPIPVLCPIKNVTEDPVYPMRVVLLMMNYFLLYVWHTAYFKLLIPEPMTSHLQWPLEIHKLL